MVFPLSLLEAAQGHPMLVELKGGETYNGMMVDCDTWMNIHLSDAICTSKDGNNFEKYPEVFVRGSVVKYIRIPDELVDVVKDEVKEARSLQRDRTKRRHDQGKPTKPVYQKKIRT